MSKMSLKHLNNLFQFSSGMPGNIEPPDHRPSTRSTKRKNRKAKAARRARRLNRG